MSTFCRFDVEIDPELILAVHGELPMKTVLQMSEFVDLTEDAAPSPPQRRPEQTREPRRPLTL